MIFYTTIFYQQFKKKIKDNFSFIPTYFSYTTTSSSSGFLIEKKYKFLMSFIQIKKKKYFTNSEGKSFFYKPGSLGGFVDCFKFYPGISEPLPTNIDSDTRFILFSVVKKEIKKISKFTPKIFQGVEISFYRNIEFLILECIKVLSIKHDVELKTKKSRGSHHVSKNILCPKVVAFFKNPKNTALLVFIFCKSYFIEFKSINKYSFSYVSLISKISSSFIPNLPSVSNIFIRFFNDVFLILPKGANINISFCRLFTKTFLGKIHLTGHLVDYFTFKYEKYFFFKRNSRRPSYSRLAIVLPCDTFNSFQAIIDKYLVESILFVKQKDWVLKKKGILVGGGRPSWPNNIRFQLDADISNSHVVFHTIEACSIINSIQSVQFYFPPELIENLNENFSFLDTPGTTLGMGRSGLDTLSLIPKQVNSDFLFASYKQLIFAHKEIKTHDAFLELSSQVFTLNGNWVTFSVRCDFRGRLYQVGTHTLTNRKVLRSIVQFSNTSESLNKSYTTVDIKYAAAKAYVLCSGNKRGVSYDFIIKEVLESYVSKSTEKKKKKNSKIYSSL